MNITDRQRTNFSWLLSGAVIALVIFNIYTTIMHKHYITNPTNNKNESEFTCPSTSTLLH